MKELKFIHITKTAGTSIENAGMAAGFRWGCFHKEYGWWHRCFPLLSPELKQKYDWFAVVRNPYDRMLSEFHCRWAINESPLTKNLSPKAIQTRNRSIFNQLLFRSIGSRPLLGGHYTEQYRYFEKETEVSILRFENLAEDFSELMGRYGLGVRLAGVENKGIERAFEVGDISRKNIGLINEVYEMDFKMFGYKMILNGWL
jgi:hypothetical protein